MSFQGAACATGGMMSPARRQCVVPNRYTCSLNVACARQLRPRHVAMNANSRLQGPDGNGAASGFAHLSSSIDSLADRIEMQRLQERRDYNALPEECRGSVQRMPHWMAQSIHRFVETVATKAVLANSLLVLWRISEGSQTNWMFLIHCSAVLGLVLYYNQSLERLQTAQFYDDDKSRLVGFYSLTYSIQLLVLLPTWAICM